MKVLVGSKNRIKGVKIKKVFDKIVLFVEPQEIEKYKTAFPDDEIVQLKENDKGFGYMLNSMVDYTLESGEKYFLFSDDDVYGLQKRYEEKKLKKVDNLDLFFERGKKILDLGYAQAMVSFQGHNWYEDKAAKENIGAWGMIFMNAEKLKAIGGYREDLEIFNDWEMSARLISGGFTNCCIYTYAFGHKMKSMKGGAMDIYKDTSRIERAINMIKSLYPQSSSIKFVPNHNQHEIRFDWKKLKSGIK